MTNRRGIFLAGLLGVLITGCGDDEEVAQSRGLPAGTKKVETGGAAAKPAEGGTRRSSPTADQSAGDPVEAESVRPDRPRPVLSREDFSVSARDPFHTYLSPVLANEAVPVEVLDNQRNVKLAEYDFESLKLIAIVNAGRNVQPRALFLSASDNKSKTVRQGEYFSRAEVLLASVNRDYIEIEIMDPELTPGWNMERGERRVIYLKDPGAKN